MLITIKDTRKYVRGSIKKGETGEGIESKMKEVERENRKWKSRNSLGRGRVKRGAEIWTTQ